MLSRSVKPDREIALADSEFLLGHHSPDDDVVLLAAVPLGSIRMRWVP